MLIATGGETAAIGIIGSIWGFFIFMYAILIGIGITLFIFWIISIVDVSQRKNEEFPSATDNSRTTWLIVLLVTLIVPVAAGISAIVYYATVMKKIPRSSEKKVLPPNQPQGPQS
ncbi:MAG: hypothetical protein ACYCXB_04570 [Candidatus Humimicrobiaceae bacterium]